MMVLQPTTRRFVLMHLKMKLQLLDHVICSCWAMLRYDDDYGFGNDEDESNFVRIPQTTQGGLLNSQPLIQYRV